ncbi:TPA: hypothetical protein DDW35_01780 [Candidatus Sumerlaeota bacterium]|jgi:hypothetical protein|nr:hypothetical protein [Candidatus Sumerlaeota bacterium]
MEPYRLDQEFYSDAFASQDADESEEVFTMCPRVFLQNMTAEELRSTQQLYQQAFEKAQRQVSQNVYKRLNPAEFMAGEGI